MSVSITYKIDGAKEIQGMLSRMKARTMDLTPVMAAFGGYMGRSIMKNFQQGGRPRPWIPSKRVSLGGKGKTLMDKGILKSSIAYVAGPRSVAIGTSVPYARIHQLGGPEKDTLIRAKGARPLAIKRWGSTLIEISPKTGRALTRKGKPGIIFRREVTLKKGAIPARPFLLFQDEDISYLHRRIRAYVTGGRAAMGGK